MIFFGSLLARFDLSYPWLSISTSTSPTPYVHPGSGNAPSATPAPHFAFTYAPISLKCIRAGIVWTMPANGGRVGEGDGGGLGGGIGFGRAVAIGISGFCTKVLISLYKTYFTRTSRRRTGEPYPQA